MHQQIGRASTLCTTYCEKYPTLHSRYFPPPPPEKQVAALSLLPEVDEKAHGTAARRMQVLQLVLPLALTVS